MNERDESRRNDERQRQRQAGSDYGTRSEAGQRGTRRWGAGEEWNDTSQSRVQGRYAGDYETGQGGGMDRQSASTMGREEADWSQGRRESQRWGEQGTYGAQGSNEFERHGSDYGRDRGEYANPRYASRAASGQGYAPQQHGDYENHPRNRANQDYSNQRDYGTQAYGQGEHSYGSHGYGSGREYRGYEGGEAGRREGARHWERGYGEGYGLSSGYADDQAYDSRYGASGYATGYVSQRDEGRGHDQLRSYRGMGPKSYTRSDERVLEDINERLTEDDYLDASDINVRCVNGVITLEGTVAERWMKHRAEDLADASSGVKQVDNRLQVKSQYASSGSEQRAGESTTTQGRTRQAGGSASPSATPNRSGGDNPSGSSPH